MPDITTTQIFSDGEKGITATKMNNIIANSVIQPDFVTAKPSSSTLDPTDQLLEVKGAGTYARITGSQLISSVSAQVDVTPQIYSVRLRSLNVLGNSTFECDQRLSGSTITVSGTFSGPIIDRWWCYKAGTGAGYCAQLGTGATAVPGTSFIITSHGLLFNTTTTQASLGATDGLRFAQQIEGSQMRALIGDVHSLQLLVSSTVSPLKFSVCLRDNPTTKSIVYLCTYNAAGGTPQLITIPNIPVWASGGNWSTQPGNLGYILEVTLACGSTYLTAPGAWASGTFLGATGMDNFLANAVNSNFVLRFIQHEPGALCTTPMDRPFTQNYDDCLRYFQKTWDYGTSPGTASANGAVQMLNIISTVSMNMGHRFKKTMAKAPTMIAYAYSNGAANSANNRANSAVVSVSSFQTPTAESPCFNLNVASGLTVNDTCMFHYTADTGW